MCKGDIIGKWSLIYISHESEQEHGIESKDLGPSKVVREQRSNMPMRA
jgi:hypothetical protein